MILLTNSITGRRALTIAAALSPLIVFLCVYGPAVGRGFISDDFGWIVQSRVASGRQALALFGDSHGFYRPIVALSFAANYAVSGPAALGYGWTNLGLALLGASLLFMLFREIPLSRGAAWFGTAMWLLNFHGMNMALLWISGRTALLLIVGAGIAILGALRGRVAIALLGFIVALFSKEEAVAIPAMWAAAYGLSLVSWRENRPFGLIVGSVIIFGAYAILRIHAGAMTPGNAPAYYHFTFAPALVGRSILEYADRACTFAAASSLVVWLILRPANVATRRNVMLFGAIWIVAGYGLTVWLPTRSDLYACYPSIGAALIASEFFQACWRESVDRRRTQLLIAAIAIPILCAPAYAARNHRWTDLADLSAAALGDIATYAHTLPSDTWLELVDDRERRVNLQSAFGTLVGDAVRLSTGRAIPVWVEPPLEHAALAGMAAPCSGCRVIRLLLRDGHLVRVD